MQHDQTGKIDASIAGPLSDAVALLSDPRLHLLDKQPVDLHAVSGQVAVKLTIGLPLDSKVTMDDIAVGAQAHLDNVRVPRLVAGRDLDQGAVDLKATNDGMTLGGQAVLGAIPATFDAAMDFRAGPPSQVLQTVSVAGQPTAAQLTQAGFNPAGIFVSGAAGLNVKLTERRDGQAQVAVAADLGAADMRLDVAGWTKAAGEAAQGNAIVRLDHNRIAGIDHIDLTGVGMSIQAQASVDAKSESVLRIDQFTLGDTSAKGSVRFPGANGGPIVATVSGTALDLSGRLSYHTPKSEQTDTNRISNNSPGQAWQVDARFDHALMANAQRFDGLVLHAESDGTLLTRLRFDARAGPSAPISWKSCPRAADGA